jgi:hypothetical protein
MPPNGASLQLVPYLVNCGINNKKIADLSITSYKHPLVRISNPHFSDTGFVIQKQLSKGI